MLLNAVLVSEGGGGPNTEVNYASVPNPLCSPDSSIEQQQLSLWLSDWKFLV